MLGTMINDGIRDKTGIRFIKCFPVEVRTEFLLFSSPRA